MKGILKYLSTFPSPYFKLVDIMRLKKNLVIKDTKSNRLEENIYKSCT